MPGISRAPVLCPLDAGREVADDRLEPDVQAFALVPWQRDRNAPVDVARDRPSAQLFDIIAGKVDDVGPPVILVVVKIVIELVG